MTATQRKNRQETRRSEDNSKGVVDRNPPDLQMKGSLIQVGKVKRHVR